MKKRGRVRIIWCFCGRSHRELCVRGDGAKSLHQKRAEEAIHFLFLADRARLLAFLVWVSMCVCRRVWATGRPEQNGAKNGKPLTSWLSYETERSATRYLSKMLEFALSKYLWLCSSFVPSIFSPQTTGRSTPDIKNLGLFHSLSASISSEKLRWYCNFKKMVKRLAKRGKTRRLSANILEWNMRQVRAERLSNTKRK